MTHYILSPPSLQQQQSVVTTTITKPRENTYQISIRREKMTCTCESFKFGGRHRFCKHTISILRMLQYDEQSIRLYSLSQTTTINIQEAYQKLRMLTDSTVQTQVQPVNVVPTRGATQLQPLLPTINEPIDTTPLHDDDHYSGGGGFGPDYSDDEAEVQQHRQQLCDVSNRHVTSGTSHLRQQQQQQQQQRRRNLIIPDLDDDDDFEQLQQHQQHHQLQLMSFQQLQQTSDITSNTQQQPPAQAAPSTSDQEPLPDPNVLCDLENEVDISFIDYSLMAELDTSILGSNVGGLNNVHYAEPLLATDFMSMNDTEDDGQSMSVIAVTTSPSTSIPLTSSTMSTQSSSAHPSMPMSSTVSESTTSTSTTSSGSKRSMDHQGSVDEGPKRLRTGALQSHVTTSLPRQPLYTDTSRFYNAMSNTTGSEYYGTFWPCKILKHQYLAEGNTFEYYVQYYQREARTELVMIKNDKAWVLECNLLPYSHTSIPVPFEEMYSQVRITSKADKEIFMVKCPNGYWCRGILVDWPVAERKSKFLSVVASLIDCDNKEILVPTRQEMVLRIDQL
ncbi:hypothetical protein SAMD00019534_083760 [Acytostelium subglobosum LB1]|uniref:hypothetical protein n=1 Tax=Acytostelium subglobosum LB1 TaxID=1410327 RepID=UPI000644885F|nr:hypothetical protein SAMD00019534_083760 [Acytostelium subglobosum LB1]GAM25201.1 hypothetical protein SAMD00019534_083760 [Acytostelium subglobosum LB1]|eukprot:XP_012751721.1 hypothetical protein SAMD00019534_083760 [Acytostelium subglobosum LB1]